jgi:hypothetical protein
MAPRNTRVTFLARMVPTGHHAVSPHRIPTESGSRDCPLDCPLEGGQNVFRFTPDCCFAQRTTGRKGPLAGDGWRARKTKRSLPGPT